MLKLGTFLATVAVAAVLVAPSAAPAAVGADDEVGLFNPVTGQWHLRYPDGRLSSFYFGNPSDTPLLGDWDCDGVDTVALYRESSGLVYLRNSNDLGVAEWQFFFGIPGDVPVAGDWDGDGCDTLGIFRNGRFFLNNQLDTSFADMNFFLGAPGDSPVAGDFNGDGKDTVGVQRGTDNYTYLVNDLSGLPRSGGVATVDGAYWRGGFDAQVVTGDWDADGEDSIGVFKPSQTKFVLANDSADLVGDEQFFVGESGWLAVAGNIGEHPGLPDLRLEAFATGLDRPLFATAPAGDDRLFVVEKPGRIKILENGVVKPGLFLDLSASVSGGSEQGLLGMAFHPNYATNGVFYVNYTNLSGDTRVVEYRRPRDVGLSGPEVVTTVLAVDQPNINHNGGMLQFGPDGRLYVGMGDGGGGGDTYGNGQNAFTPLGGVVALDVDGTRPDHVWAIGLRNPWRFDWDGELIYIGDVGQNAFEEVSIGSRLSPRRNFGWSAQEGFACYPIGTTGCDTSAFVQPVVAYPHPEGCSVAGGFVYRGAAIDGLDGAYLYSDLCGKFLRGFFYDGSAIAESREWAVPITASVLSFGEDGHGELYLLTIDGTIAKIVAG